MPRNPDESKRPRDDPNEVHRMKPIEFENGAVEIDAAIVADGLGLALPRLQKEMRAARSRVLSSAGSTPTAAGIA